MPGTTRSPVNSSNLRLRFPGMDFDPAGHLNVAVNRRFAAPHLHRDGVVDPVADIPAVGDGRRKRKCPRVELRQIELEINSAVFARLQRLQVLPFAGGICRGEVETQMVAHQKTRHRTNDMLLPPAH